MLRAFAILGWLSVAPLAAAGGWVCHASGAWAPCPAPGADASCAPREVTRPGIRLDRARAEAVALEACRTEMSRQRLAALWHGAPASDEQPPGHIARPCAVSACAEDPALTEDPIVDAFDEPVCLGVRAYVCELCGTTSPLCARVQRERPVAAEACSDTHVQLEGFVSVLEQFDTIHPGSLRDAVGEMCGTYEPLVPSEPAPPEPSDEE